MREMEMRWAAASAPAARPKPRRRAPDQPSFSSTLLDAICDSMDEGEPGRDSRPRNAEAAAAAAAAKKRQELAAGYYYYKPSLATSYRASRAAPAQGNGGAASPADCHGRGYFSSSEVEYSLRRLRPIRTSGGSGGDSAAISRKQPDVEKTTRAAKKPASSSARACRRPASPGARLASLLNSIFSGKRPSAQRRACSPGHQEPACSTAPPLSYARPCLAKTPSTTTARARPSRSRTVRFLDIDGKVAVAAAVAGCRRIPVVEVEADTDGGEESSDASSDLFELDNLAAIAPASCAGGRGGSYRDELPVYGTTGVEIHRDIGRRRPYGYAHGQSWSRAV